MQKVCKTLSNKIANMSALCSLMVVVIHVLKREQLTGSCAWHLRRICGEGLCRIAVPFFFAAAGYFISVHFNEKGWWWREVSKRIKSLLIPFFAWSAICFVLCSILIAAGNIQNGKSLWDGLVTVKRLLIAFGVNPFTVPELRQLWFVRVLFVLVLLSPLLRLVGEKLTKQLGKSVYIVMLWLCWTGGKYILGKFISHDVWIPLNFGYFSFEGVAFFMLGMYLQTEKINIYRNNIKVGCAFLLTGFLGLVAHCPACVVIPLLLVGAWLCVPDNPLPVRIQGLHFPIYLVHLNVVFVYFAFLDSKHITNMAYFFDPGVSVLGELAGFMIVTFVSLAICMALQRLSASHAMFGRILFGGRK